MFLRSYFLTFSPPKIAYFHGVKPIRNIIFDLGGVLLPVDYDAVLTAFGKLGPAPGASFYSQQAQQPLFDRLERGEITGGEFLFGLKQLFPDASENDLTAAWNAILGRFASERLELLKKIRKHYRIFLLSNTNEIHIRRFLENLKTDNGVEDFTEYFEEVYFSYETGFRKPEKEIFELVLLENKLDAAETLFIEDTEANVHGALSVGIPTVWLHVKEGETVEQLFSEEGVLTEKAYSAVLMPENRL